MACGAQAPAILGYYAASIAFASRHFTDGVILPADLPLLIPSARPRPALIEQLVSVGLWDSRPAGGWVIHDFLEHNNSADYRRAKLQADAARKSRAASDGNRHGVHTDSKRIPPVEPSLASPRLASPRREEPRRAKPSRAGHPPTPSGFERFWDTYPRKIGRDDAAGAWRRKACELLTQDILAAVERQRDYLMRADVAQGKKAGDLCPYPATWLNKGRWKDEPPTERSVDAKTHVNTAGIATWLEEQRP